MKVWKVWLKVKYLEGGTLCLDENMFAFFGPTLNVQISIKEGLAKWSPQTCLWTDMDTLTPLIKQISGIDSKYYKS